MNYKIKSSSFFVIYDIRNKCLRNQEIRIYQIAEIVPAVKIAWEHVIAPSQWNHVTKPKAEIKTVDCAERVLSVQSLLRRTKLLKE